MNISEISSHTAANASFYFTTLNILTIKAIELMGTKIQHLTLLFNLPKSSKSLFQKYLARLKSLYSSHVKYTEKKLTLFYKISETTDSVEIPKTSTTVGRLKSKLKKWKSIQYGKNEKTRAYPLYNELSPDKKHIQAH